MNWNVTDLSFQSKPTTGKQRLTGLRTPPRLLVLLLQLPRLIFEKNVSPLFDSIAIDGDFETTTTDTKSGSEISSIFFHDDDEVMEANGDITVTNDKRHQKYK